MATSTNPFKPTAGKMPPILIGRQPFIDDFQEALANGIGAPGRIMLVTGQRGYGKTVLLTEFRRIAAADGWLTISETASTGLVDRLVAALDPREGIHVEGASLAPAIAASALGSATLGGVALSREAAPLTLRSAMQRCLTGRRTKKGRGVLITIDEMQSADRDDIVAIATAIQHTIAASDESPTPERDKRGVAIVFAGLPSMTNELVNNRTTTFLRRALQRELDAVPLPDVRDAYVETVRESGKSMDADLAMDAANCSKGYPYMIQLIGYYMWRAAARRDSDTIEAGDLESGYNDAIIEFDRAVCAPALDGLGEPERAFLKAMATASTDEDGRAVARVADIIAACGKSRSWVGKYRSILIEDRLIAPAGHGILRFTIPHLRDYLLGRQCNQD